MYKNGYMSKWFDLWFDDKESILKTMVKNMSADLEAGYSYFSESIKRQREAIEEYKKQFDAEIEKIKAMSGDVKVIDRYCYHDMKKRGTI